MPAEVTEQEFKEFLDLNKINYAKAERLTSKNDGRVLENFLIGNQGRHRSRGFNYRKLTCPITGVIYRVEEFRTPISVQQCWNCQSFGHSAKTCRSQTKCLICGEGHHHKGCPNKEKKQPKCANCKGLHVASYKGCPAYKKQAFRQHVVPKIVCLNSTPKLGSPTTPGQGFHIFGRTTYKIRSKCGHSSSSATSLPC